MPTVNPYFLQLSPFLTVARGVGCTRLAEDTAMLTRVGGDWRGGKLVSSSDVLTSISLHSIEHTDNLQPANARLSVPFEFTRLGIFNNLTNGSPGCSAI